MSRKRKGLKMAGFETETCSRCGGTGEFSYCQMYGRTCFRCGGKRITLTPRGAAASNYLKELRSVPAAEIKIGDRIKFPMITMGGQSYTKIATVYRVRREFNRGASLINGVMVDYEVVGIVVETTVGGMHANHATPVYRVDSPEVQRGQYAAAIEYQATLTRAGKPRKRVAVF